MTMNIPSLSLITAAFVLLNAPVLAQTPPQASPAPTITAAPTAVAPAEQQTSATTQNMDKMATTVTRMAEMCEMMMQKEKAAMPYIAAAGITFGALLLIALILFVILELQWIIYWKRLLKGQKRNETVAAP